MAGTKLKLNTIGYEISVIAYEDQEDYIILTDIAKQKIQMLLLILLKIVFVAGIQLNI